MYHTFTKKSAYSKNVVKKVFSNFLKFISNLVKIPILRGFRWWPISESNQGHSDFQSLALPTELIGHKEKVAPNTGFEPVAK